MARRNANGGNPAQLFAWLEKARREWGLSQAEMAEQVGVSANGMRGYRDGHRPQATKLAMIAKGTGVTVEGLERIMRGEKVPVPAAPPRPPAEPDIDLETRMARIEAQYEVVVDLLERALGRREVR